jgi:hypothetical protein
VSHPFVESIKPQVVTVTTSDEGQTVTGSDGKEYPAGRTRRGETAAARTSRVSIGAAFANFGEGWGLFPPVLVFKFSFAISAMIEPPPANGSITMSNGEV